MKRFLLLMVFCLLLMTSIALAGTTGKVSGKVTDAESGDPLPGANIFLEGTSIGAAADLEGDYVILNIPPGNYTIIASMMGYTDFKVANVRVNIDLTTTIDFQMTPTVIAAGGEVTIVAERPVVVKDVSASQANIEAAQIESLPVQRIDEAIGYQAGILGTVDNGIQIRGGDQDETAFMIDGFTIRDERNNIPYTSISLSSIEAVQVQTGGFNAEYGNIRSGIINVVTKEGDKNHYNGTITVYYSPASRKNFGPSGFSPDGYWARPFLDDEVAWTGTENGAWDLNTQRQYPRFEGWNAVSERTLRDDDPDNDLTPEAAQQLWKWEHRRRGDIDDPDYNIDLGFGGPVPFISKPLGNLRFFFTHRREQDAYLIRLSRDTFNDQNYHLKLTSNITPNSKLIVSGFYSRIKAVSDNQIGNPTYFRSAASVASELSRRSFIDAIMWVPDYFAPTQIRRYNVSAKFTQTLSSRSFYEVQIEHQLNKYRTFPRRLRDTETIVNIFGNSYGVDEAPYGFMPFPSSGIAGMRMGVGMSNSRDSTKITTTTVKFDLTSQINRTNLIKTGAELVIGNHQARYGGVDLTLPAGRPQSRWDKTPVRAAVYLQDKLEFKGLIANLGLRLDYTDPGGTWIDLESDPYNRDFLSSNFVPGTEEQFEQKPTKRQLYLSPRLGISHPITDNSKLYFNYGHFYSIPEARRLYLEQRTNNSQMQILGNPNLKLSRTKSYEIGFEQNLIGQFLLRIAGYYKDVSNQPNLVRIISSDSQVNYRQADDNFYEDIRGLEFSLEKRLGSWLSGFLNYTYMVNTSGFFGKLQLRENPAEQRAEDRKTIDQSKPTPRPYARGNLHIFTPKDFGPQFVGWRPLANWRTSLIFLWRAGRHTTWSRGLDANLLGIRNNVQLPDFISFSLRLSRDFRIGKFRAQFFMDVSNLFNNKIFNFASSFSDGNDFRDYMDSLLWPEKIGKPLGYSEFGHDKIGDLRPSNVAYDPLEPNPQNEPEIEARNQQRRKTKSYIDNPNLRWLYYLNPRDVTFGFRFDF
ncbi:MAG: carboxypeptidase-like regulatory domain-containing protein [bacterium]